MAPPPEAPPPIAIVCASIVLGAAGLDPELRLDALAAAAIGGLAFALTWRRRRAAVAGLALAAFASSGWLQAHSWRDASRRLGARFGTEATWEGDLVCTVSAAPERAAHGERVLEVVAGRAPAAGALRLRLRVPVAATDEAARIDGLRRGDRLRVWARLFAPEPRPESSGTEARRRLAAQGIDASGRVKNSRLVQRTAEGPAGPRRALDALRARTRRALDRVLGHDGPVRAVLGAMLMGDRHLLDSGTNRLLRDAGLVHLLSISGLHTSITVLALVALLRRLGLGAPARALTAGLGLVALVAFAGHGPAVRRAAGGLMVVLAARAAGRSVDALSALGLASAMLVVADPPLAWNLGFQLSVLATAGLVALGPPMARHLPGPRWLARGAGASLGAYLATAPVLADAFGRLAPAGLVANLVAAPLCAACLATAATAAWASPGFVPASAAGWAASWSVEAMLDTARAASSLPFGRVIVAAPSRFVVVIYVATLLGAWLGPARFGPGHRRLTRALFALGVAALHLGPAPSSAAFIELSVLDVGQGLAVLVQGPTGVAIVDAGPGGEGRFDAGERVVLPAIASTGRRRVDVLALSHDHADHTGGAGALLRDLEVGELWLPVGSERDDGLSTLAADAVARGVAVRRLRRGDTCERIGLAFEALHPGGDDLRRSVNDRCLALRACARTGACVALPGDLEEAGEGALLEAGVPHAELLIAPHHGARASSSMGFLEAVAPLHVVVSSGAGNRFGHPSPFALERYRLLGAHVRRTDLEGTVRFVAEGSAWRHAGNPPSGERPLR